MVSIEKTVTKSEVRIRLDGCFDILMVQDFKNEVHRALQTVPKKLVLDCRNLRMISSIGIRELMHTRRELEKLGGTMVFTGLSSRLVSILQCIGVDHLFELEN